MDMYFRNIFHKRNFLSRVKKKNVKQRKEYLAVLYLVSADSSLWKMAKKEIYKDRIHLSKMNICGISTVGYTLLKVALDIQEKSSNISINNLCDKYLIPKDVYQLVLTAVEIGREGYKAVDCVEKINDEENKDGEKQNV